MITDQARNEVWQEIYDATRLIRYYSALLVRYRRYYWWTRIALLASGTAGVAAFFELLPSFFNLVFGALIALVIVVEVVVNLSNQVTVLQTTIRDCTELEGEWRDLWHRINREDISENETWEKIRQLSQRGLVVTSRAAENVQQDQRLNEECEEAAYDVLVSRYS